MTDINWFKSKKHRYVSLNEITLMSKGIFINNEIVKNLALLKFNYAQVAIINDDSFILQFTTFRLAEAGNYRVSMTRSGAMRINCKQFVQIYFNIIKNPKYAHIETIEKDEKHLILQCKIKNT